MEIEKLLRQLHKIEPDREYARNSKARILTAISPLPRFTIRTFVAGVFRSGSVMAVTGLLLLLAIGGFSVSRLAGFFSGLDNSLYAEAQAIDIQIHLADLQYETSVRQALTAPDAEFGSATGGGIGFGSASGSETDGEIATSSVEDVGVTEEEDIAPEEADVATSSDPAKPVGVEQALDILSR